jgi:hypothetical protein
LAGAVFQLFPSRRWLRKLIGIYEARELVGFDRFLHVQAWLDRGLARCSAGCK